MSARRRQRHLQQWRWNPKKQDEEQTKGLSVDFLFQNSPTGGLLDYLEMRSPRRALGLETEDLSVQVWLGIWLCLWYNSKAKGKLIFDYPNLCPISITGTMLSFKREVILFIFRQSTYWRNMKEIYLERLTFVFWTLLGRLPVYLPSKRQR